MDNVSKLIKEKTDSYLDFKKTLGYSSTTARSLGFDAEVKKIENDRRWVNEIIELLGVIDLKLNEVNPASKTKQ